MKVVILGDITLNVEDSKRLKKIAEVVTYKNDSWDDEQLLKDIEGAEVVISFLVKFSADVIKKAAGKGLKLIALATTGYDAVDLKAAKENNVLVSYCPGYATEAVAEHTIGLMLAAARLTAEADHDCRVGIFKPTEYTGEELSGKILGVIGWGRIGRRVGEIAHEGLNMEVLHLDKDYSQDDYKKLFTTSDVITLHVPLLKSTQNMIGEEQFKVMKDGVIIINTARGGLIDENALEKALNSGKVFAAGLDVYAKEPPFGSPLLKHPNVVVTPHISFNTKEALEARSKMVVDNVLSYTTGNPSHLI